MNYLNYIASYADLRCYVKNNIINENVPEHLHIKYIEEAGYIHYTKDGKNEITKGLRVNPDFDPYIYVSSCQNLKNQFWCQKTLTINEESVAYHFILNDDIYSNHYSHVLNRELAIKFLMNRLSIVLVGGAPLTEVQQNEINMHDIVFRVNHAPSFRQGDKFDYLFYRNNCLKNYKNDVIKACKNCKVLCHYDKTKKVSETQKYLHVNGKSLNIHHPQVPSAGYVTFHLIKHLYPNNNIHLYGFSFLGHKKNEMNYEMQHLVKDKKVIIHECKDLKNVHHGNTCSNIKRKNFQFKY